MQNVLVRPKAAVLQPSGSLNAANVVQFQDQLNAAVLSDQHSSLLIDMGQVEFIDSAGLMVLVSGLKMAKRLNKQLSLCAVPHAARMVFELTELDRVFDIHDSASVAA